MLSGPLHGGANEEVLRILLEIDSLAGVPAFIKRVETGETEMNWMHSSPGSVVAILTAISFAAGLNVYATIASLGLLARVHLVVLPGSLDALQNNWVIAASLVLFLIEFFGDKIPAFDLIWNALHTFVRIPVAALLAYLAAAQLPPEMKLFCTLLGGLIALAAHGGKTAARAVVTPSPEPLSNISLSLGEDAIAVALTWLATKHPYLAAGIALMGVAVIILFVRLVIRALRALFGGAARVIEN